MILVQSGCWRAHLPVLVVDDDDEVRVLLEREVRDLGHPVEVAVNAVQALEAIARRSFAIVITDIRMPGPDGLDLAELVHARSPGTEVILITGYASVQTAATAVRLGVVDYLVKPFALDQLRQGIDRCVERRRQRLAQAQTLASLVERLPLAVILLDGAGRPLVLNRRASALVEEKDGIALAVDGRLVTPSVGQTARLKKIIASRGGLMCVGRPSGRPDLSLLVAPLVDGQVGSSGACSALFIGDPEARSGTTEAVLHQLYALTPAEARLTVVLLQGKSVEQAADELRITQNTARTHLKRVFSKTGTSRQGDLISLLLSGPAAVQYG